MSKNALLEAPIASDRTPAGSYHSSMDGNGQLRQAPVRLSRFEPLEALRPTWHSPNRELL